MPGERPVPAAAQQVAERGGRQGTTGGMVACMTDVEGSVGDDGVLVALASVSTRQLTSLHIKNITEHNTSRKHELTASRKQHKTTTPVRHSRTGPSCSVRAPPASIAPHPQLPHPAHAVVVPPHPASTPRHQRKPSPLSQCIPSPPPNPPQVEAALHHLRQHPPPAPSVGAPPRRQHPVLSS